MSTSGLVEERARLVIVFLLAAMIIYTVASTSVLTISSSDLGLLNKLPITFWIGTGLLAFLWYLARNSQRYQIVSFVFTLSFLYYIPAIVRVPVWISESYYPFGESVLINTYGHLVTPSFALETLGVQREFPLMSYQYWPLFLYLASSFTLVTGLPHSIILKFFPLLTISLYGILTFLILRVKLKTSFAIFGATWFLGAFFTRQNYFGPQGIAYILFLLIILVMYQLFFSEQQQKKEPFIAFFLILFTVITLTHALTSLMALVVVIAVYLTQRMQHSISTGIAARLCLFSAVVLSSYSWFVAQDFFTRGVQTFAEAFLGLGDLGLYREASRIVGSEAQRLNYWVSWSIVLLTGLIAGIQVLYVLSKLILRKQRKEEEFSLFTVFWLAMALVFALSAVYGSNEAYQRAFMFGLIPLTYLCISLLSKKPQLLLIILSGLLVMNVVAQYGADSYRIATDPVLSGTSFFVHETPNDISCLYNFYPHVRYFNPLKIVNFVAIPGTLPFTEYPSSSVVNKAVTQADYIIRSSLQHNYYLYFLREDPLDQASFDKLNRIYDNPSLQIFTHP